MIYMAVVESALLGLLATSVAVALNAPTPAALVAGSALALACFVALFWFGCRPFFRFRRSSRDPATSPSG